MALLLYPNISGLEMVLFFFVVVVVFQFYSSRKTFKPRSFGVAPSSPRLPRSEDSKSPGMGVPYSTNSSDQSTKVKLFLKKKKKNQKALLIVRIDSQKISNCSSTAAASGIYIFQSSKSFLFNSLTICANICHQVKVLSPFTKTVCFSFFL